MGQRQHTEIDEALLDALATYAMDLQELLRRYADQDECRCSDLCLRCEALALLDGDG